MAQIGKSSPPLPPTLPPLPPTPPPQFPVPFSLRSVLIQGYLSVPNAPQHDHDVIRVQDLDEVAHELGIPMIILNIIV